MKDRRETQTRSLRSLSGACFSAHAQETVTQSIAGVVNAGTPITLVKDGFEAVEGPLALPDGGLLFTNNKLGRIVRIATDGTGIDVVRRRRWG